jgi:hypothetical protein
MVATANERGSWGNTRSEKKIQRSHWAENRRVAIFPDVPGQSFRPEHSMIITTKRQRDIVSKVVSAIFERLNGREDKNDKRPRWLRTEP